MNTALSSRHPLVILLIAALLCTAHGGQSQTASPAQRTAASPQTRPTPGASATPGARPAPTPNLTPAPDAAPASSNAMPRAAAVQEAPPRKVAESSAAEMMDAEEFERVLAADGYAFFGEMRDLAGTLNSTLITESLAPYTQLGEMPRELTLLREFVTRHTEALDSARISFAAQPARPNLPSMVLRIRLADEQIARSLAEPLRRLLRQLDMTPNGGHATMQTTTTASAVVAADVKPAVTVKTAKDSQTSAKPVGTPPKPADSFIVKQHGSALFISDAEFDVAALKPAGDNPALADSANFQTAYARFAAAPLFVYYNLETADREIRRAAEERALRAKNSSATQEVETVAAADPIASGAMTENTDALPDDLSIPDSTPAEDIEAPPIIAAPEVVQNADATQTTNMDPAIEGDTNASIAMPALGMIFPSIFGGASGIVDALGGAKAMGMGLTIEASEISLRVMLVTPEGGTVKPVPFLPMLVGGAPAESRAAAMLPADTDVFFSLSIDLSRSYDEALAAFDAAARRSIGNPQAHAANAALGVEDEAGTDKASAAALSIDLIEQRFGFKIKDELLASLGGEIAVAVLRAAPPQTTDAQTTTESTLTTTTQNATPYRTPTTNGAGEGGILILVSVTDRERLKRLLPRALEAAGMAAPAGADSVIAANMFRKQGEIETITISGGSAAFIGDYLVLATGGASLERIAELARSGGSSLLSAQEFTSARLWQPRDKLAEVYVSGSIAESLFIGERRSLIAVAGELKSYFDQFAGTTPEPFTYALSGDPQGTLHELRIPRSAIIALAAYAAADTKHGEKMRNERSVAYTLISLAESEKAYHEKHNRYASLKDLRKAELYWQDDITATGYKVDFDVSASSFRVSATPTQHNVTGRRSFYIDQNALLRGADHGGRPATAADPQTQP